MKGFIEINVCDKATLINVNQIESICQHQNHVEIYMIGNSIQPWVVNDSYEEIVNKIKQAIED